MGLRMMLTESILLLACLMFVIDVMIWALLVAVYLSDQNSGEELVMEVIITRESEASSRH